MRAASVPRGDGAKEGAMLQNGKMFLRAAMAACLYDAAFSTLGRIFGQGARTTIATNGI